MKYEPCPKCREKGQDSRGDNLVIWPDGTAHCFSCRHHVHKRATGLRQELYGKVEHGPKSVLPVDFSRQVPTTAWKWLLQYGLPYSYWKESVGYSEKEGRLVFQIPNSKSMAFSIGRRIGGTGGGKWKSWGDSHKTAAVVGEQVPDILVEDWISANKIASSLNTPDAPQRGVLPLFGTEVHPCHVYALRDGSKAPVVLWLDKDQQGLTAKKAVKLELLTNRPVTIVHTDKDPKSLSINEIKEILK